MSCFIIPGTQKQVINYCDIVIIAADGRGCDFYVITNVLKKEYKRIASSHNLGYYKKQLGESSLFNAHKKYIVNMEQVAGYDSKYILEMKIYIGIAVKVAKRKTGEFKNKLRNSR